jgi:hypothetical protein
VLGPIERNVRRQPKKTGDNMWDQIQDFISDHALGEVGKAVGLGIGSVIVGWLTKDWFLNALAHVFRNKKRTIRGEKWHSAFVQNGAVMTETVKLRSIPFIERYLGVVEYRRRGNSVSHYSFVGQLTEGFFTATYKSQEEGTSDYGAWTLKLNSEGNALVGAYVWLVKDGQIGHDFYQWTEHDLGELAQNTKSNIHGVGLTASVSLPEGALVGELRGTTVPRPTQKSITVDKRHIDPADDCPLGSINHSCRPNAKLSGRLLFLTAPVSEDDEITIDYRQTEREILFPFICNCSHCEKGKPAKIG